MAGGQPNPEHAAHLLYLKGLMFWKAGNTGDGMACLEKCVSRHMELANSQPLGLDTYVLANPMRVMAVVKLLMSVVGSNPRAPTDPPSPVLAKCTR